MAANKTEVPSKSGRPSVITPEVVSILSVSFHSGLSVREACWQSGISHEAYYRRVRSDVRFADIMHRAQSAVNILSKHVIVDAINKGDLNSAKWWLERRSHEEFGKNPVSLEQEVEEEAQRQEPMSEEEVNRLASELRELLADESLNT